MRVVIEEIREALKEPMAAICDSIRRVLEARPRNWPPISSNAAWCSPAAGALLRRLEAFMANRTNVPARVADDPLVLCGARRRALCRIDAPADRRLGTVGAIRDRRTACLNHRKPRPPPRDLCSAQSNGRCSSARRVYSLLTIPGWCSSICTSQVAPACVGAVGAADNRPLHLLPHLSRYACFAG